MTRANPVTLDAAGRRAILTGPSRLAVRTCPDRPLAPGEARLRVAATLTCSNDVRDFTLGRSRVFGAAPVALGHETAGVIVEAAPGWVHAPVGRPVALVLRSFCHACEACAGGDAARCVNPRRYTGAFADELILPGTLSGDDVLPCSRSVPPRVAALTDALACVVHAAHHIPPGARVLVAGLGLVGLLTASVLQGRGHEAAGVSRRAQGIRRAAGLGIVASGWHARRGCVDCCVDTTGTSESIERCLDSVRTGGLLLLMSRGTWDRDLRIAVPASRIVRDGVIVRGAYHHDAADRRAAAAILEAAPARFTDLVPVTHDLSAIEQAFDDVRADRHVRASVGTGRWSDDA